MHTKDLVTSASISSLCLTRLGNFASAFNNFIVIIVSTDLKFVGSSVGKKRAIMNT